MEQEETKEMTFRTKTNRKPQFNILTTDRFQFLLPKEGSYLPGAAAVLIHSVQSTSSGRRGRALHVALLERLQHNNQ